MTRITKWVWVMCLLCLLCEGGAVPSALAEAPAIYGADANPTGEPLGGGKGYSRIILTGNYRVETKEQFLDALKRAQPGEVIYLVPTAEIDLTGFVNLQLPRGVTIAGNRGYEDSPGPLIYTNQLNTYPLLSADHLGIRITGIRLRGPDPEKPQTCGLRIWGDKTEVDNSEIYNWSNAGVCVGRAKDVYIHHNFIHNVRRPGLGYPVVFDSGTGLVEANIFDYYRHAIAGSGTKGTGYEARYNLVLEHAISHAFDMHGGRDYCPGKSCTEPEKDIFMAGEYVNIHHNTFYITSYGSIVIRGVPREYVDIHHNWFIDPSPNQGASYRYYHGGNARIYDNVYGPDKTLIEVMVTPSAFIYPQGSNAIAALADGSKLSFGFAKPSAKSTETVRGTVNIELLPITAEGSMKDAFAYTGVKIRLAGETIYQGKDVPAPGELTLDTTKLSNGTYALLLEIDTNLGGVLQKNVFIKVEND